MEELERCPLLGFRRGKDEVYRQTKNPVWNFVLPVLLIGLFSVVSIMVLQTLKGEWNSNSLWGYLLAVAIFVPFLLLPLFAVTISTMIDIPKNRIRVQKRNVKGKKATRTFPIDDLRVNAVRMGATPDPGSGVSTRERWIVKAGFEYENFDWAVYSQETTSLEECESVMLELYHFFFPSRPSVGKENILTNGNQAYLLADEEKESFLRTHGTEGGE